MARSVQDMVRDFHERFNHPIGGTPKNLPYDRRIMRSKLIDEEIWEMFHSESLEEDVDALADIVYLCYGMALELGVDLDAVIEVVHEANMRKLGPDGLPIYREDGKVLKPEGWEGPDIAGELDRQRGLR